jgi:hypothetical protein
MTVGNRKLPEFQVGTTCSTIPHALVVALPFSHPVDLVNLRRMCELASVVYNGWKLRVYTHAALTEEQQRVMTMRCTLCYEEVIVSDPSLPMWWAKYHALSDASLSTGLFRSIHSRPNFREGHEVKAFQGKESKFRFHVIRDHPELHDVPIVPHLWGFKGPAADRGEVIERWKRLKTEFGEEVFLAHWSVDLLPLMEASDAFFLNKFPNGHAFGTPRKGIDYCGRLADHRERDMLQGWKALHHISADNRKKSNGLPKCLSRWTPKPATLLSAAVEYNFPPPPAVRDEERRYLAYSFYGTRSVDRDELIKVMTLLKRRDFYWGWGVLLYIRSDVPDATLDAIIKVGFPVEIYLVDIQGECSHLAKDPMIWRGHFSMILEHVDRFVSRDADSIIWAREWHAVQEWIASGLNFHLMRDHNNGHDNAVMGGMWGAVNNALPNMEELVKANYPAWTRNDQDFYAAKMYPTMLDQQLGHDSQNCLRYLALPFPDPTWIHFVGQTPTYRHNPVEDAAACSSVFYDDFKS